MIIRCHHLREAGILTGDCCAHCHIHAGLVGWTLPNEHEAHICCAWVGPFSSEEIELLLARMPLWACLATPIAFSEPEIPRAFRPAYQAIQRLEGSERFRAALVLGPVAQGEATEHSTLEVWVIVLPDHAPERRPHYNSLLVQGVRLNLAFASWNQFHNAVYRDIERSNKIEPVFLARSLIVFDKTGLLQRMREGARQLLPRSLSPFERQALYARLCDWRLRIREAHEHDLTVCVYLMHESLVPVLTGHYRLQQRWWPGNHHVLSDLRHWDHELAGLVEQFLIVQDEDKRFHYWSEFCAFVLKSLDDQPDAIRRLCGCNQCQSNWQYLSVE